MAARPEAPDIPYRTLGRTGERVSAIGLGGWHLSLRHVAADTAHRIVRTAIDAGITFMDNSWDYNDGESERRMGKALKDGYRDRVFLMTKIDGRTRAEAAKQLDESLKRLDVDCVDLVQHHEILRFDDPHRIFDEDGAHGALLEARQAGKIRYMGFTGHKDPEVHLHMLQVMDMHGVQLDTAQMPLNVMDAHYRSFAKRVVPELVRRDMGVLGMKPLANGQILASGTVGPIECLHYAMNLPTSVVITGCDTPEILDQALEAARTFRPLPEERLAELMARTAPSGRDGRYELFKTSSVYDGTATNPQWLGEEPERKRSVMQA